MAELEARLADRGGVQDRQKTCGIRHHDLIEERLVGVEQRDQIDVAFEVGRLVPDLLQRPLQLRLRGIDAGGKQAGQSQGLALSLGEGSGFVAVGIAQELDPAVRSEQFCTIHG